MLIDNSTFLSGHSFSLDLVLTKTLLLQQFLLKPLPNLPLRESASHDIITARMTAKTTFTVQPRQVVGKKVKTLRQEGLIPANIHGSVKNSISVSMDQVDFRDLFHEVGETGLVYITVEGTDQQRPVLVDDIQFEPVTGDVTHVVFKQVNLKEKLTAEVPLVFTGEIDIPEAVLVTVRDSVEVKALPTDLPEKFEVDITALKEIGDSILLSDLEFDESKITLEVESLDGPIIMLQAQEEEPEEEEEVVTEVIGEDGEVIEVEGEGEVPAEGEAEAAETETTETE
jgi:large subunit ribosomal protein L25